MANYKVLATWDISIQNLYKDITLIQQGISCKLNISLRSISRVTVNYKVGNEYVTDLCTIDLDNNKVIVPFKKNVLEVGTHALELVCHMKNGDVLPTPNYSYTVTKSLDNTNDITEEDAYPILIEMIQELTKNEAVLQANEEARANAEMYRELNEDERQNAEAERKANENIRISNENIRQSNESSRQQYETQRRVEEDERLTDEQVRVNAENIRIANENERLRKEIERQNAEELRQIAYNSSLYGRMDEAESQLADILEVNVKDFGAIGDGITNDVQAIQDAINYCQEHNKILKFPSAKFKLDDELSIKGNKKIRLVGSGNTEFICDKKFVVINNDIVSTKNITNDIAENASEIIVNNISNLSKGQLVVIETDQLMPETSRGNILRISTALIDDFNNTTILLDRPVKQSYKKNGYNLLLKAYDVAEIHIENINIIGTNSSLQSSFSIIECNNISNFHINNVTFNTIEKLFQGDNGNFYLSALSYFRSTDGFFSDLKFDYIHYGVLFHYGSNYGLMKNCRGYRIRHLNNTAYGSCDFTLKDSIGYRCYAALDSHQSAIDTYFYNCKDLLPTEVSKFRGRIDIMENCYFDKGIELNTDPGLKSENSDSYIKHIIGCTIKGDRVRNDCFKLLIRDSIINATIYPTTNAEKMTILDTIVNIEKRQTDGFCVTPTCETLIKNCVFNGPYKGVTIENSDTKENDVQCIYFTNKVTVDVENVKIDGFRSGFTLWTSTDLTGSDYNLLSIKNVDINNCVYGINQNAVNKYGMIINGITFNGCFEDITNPTRFRIISKDKISSDSINIGRTLYGAAIPTEGYWRKNDIIYNTSDSDVFCWVCTTSGTPGVWKAIN